LIRAFGIFKICPYFTHWVYWCHIFANIQNAPICFPTGYIGVTWLGTLKMYSACTHWAYWGHMAGYIQNVLNILSLGTLESHVDCALSVFTMYPVGICAPVPSETKTAGADVLPPFRSPPAHPNVPNMCRPSVPSLVHQFLHFPHCRTHPAFPHRRTFLALFPHIVALSPRIIVLFLRFSCFLLISF